MSQRPDKKTNKHSEITHNSGIKSVSHRSQAKPFLDQLKIMRTPLSSVQVVKFETNRAGSEYVKYLL